MKKLDVMDIVNYILDGHNITETANYFGVARKTIYNYLSIITDQNSKDYNEILTEKINLVLEKLKLEARKKAGEKSKRKQALSDADTYLIIEQILTNKLPLRMLAKMYNCSHTTIANAIKRVASDEVLEQIRLVYNNFEDISWKR